MSEGPGASGPDRLIHEPARLKIMTVLFVSGSADFTYLLRECELTKGNLSAQLTRLEQAGYVAIEKGFRGRIPYTRASLTKSGRRAFREYRRYLATLLQSTEGP